MIRVVRWMLAAGGLLVAAGLAVAIWRVTAYLEAGQAVSSTSGLVVFRVGEELVQYPPFVVTVEPVLVGVGVAVIAAAVFVAAVRYPVSAASRASTAGSNADAQTR